MSAFKNKINKYFGYLMISVFGFTLFSCSNTKNSQPLYDNHNKPTIDFIQPNLFVGKDLAYINKHYAKLKEKGYDTVIMQWSCTYKDGKPYQEYYYSNVDYKFTIGDVLINMKTAAIANDMKIIVGLQNDGDWYDYHIHGFNKDYMARLFNESKIVIDELLLGDHIDGLYFSNELFTTSNGYEKQWIDYINNVIDYIETKDKNMPLWISPFSFTNNKFSSVLWKSIFQKVHFRSFDQFLLQDGFGREPVDLTWFQPYRIFQYNRIVRDYALTYSNVQFCINIELFAENGYGVERRVRRQLEYANKLGDKVASFSYSHYYIKIQD